jgi:hypothetical protein
MQGRVSAALLHAVRLPSLVTHSLHEYEAVASRLIAHRQVLLAALRRHLVLQRSQPRGLFDTVSAVRDLETAYRAMWDVRLAALSAASHPPSTSPSHGDDGRCHECYPAECTHNAAACPAARSLLRRCLVHWRADHIVVGSRPL